ESPAMCKKNPGGSGEFPRGVAESGSFRNAGGSRTRLEPGCSRLPDRPAPASQREGRGSNPHDLAVIPLAGGPSNPIAGYLPESLLVRHAGIVEVRNKVVRARGLYARRTGDVSRWVGHRSTGRHSPHRQRLTPRQPTRRLTSPVRRGRGLVG